MNRVQKLKHLHRNRDMLWLAAVCQFAVGVLFAWMSVWEGAGTLHAVVGLLLLAAGMATVWRIRSVGKATAQLHAAADEPRDNATAKPDPSRAARG
jgi:xanthosine utilization system XapX-like protein